MANRKSTDTFILIALTVLALGAVVFAIAFPNTPAGDRIGAFIDRMAGPQDFTYIDPVPVCSSSGAFLCVIDGDTLRYGDERLRLSSIDAPEIREPQCAVERQLGERARDRLSQVLTATRFHVRYDGHDRFDRDLVELRNNDGIIGAQLVDEGLAHWFGDDLGWC